ncbi:MAG: hypothetical protein JWN03_3727 [Nocardia sp.]|uniref:hypothetical protein n=1 Tax=Nocardia sp. TaxID=1821 RepID=UPI0026134CA5|nr:hypothetical protein [Nocardia sp.]MCU1643452.1 hypothetical protein [Nocardia sp.]
MADRLKAYSDLLRTAAGKTAAVQDGIQQVVNTLVSSSDSRGEPWGDDSLGNQFANGANGYTKSKTNILEGANNMAGTFGNFSQGQLDAVTKLTNMDQGNASGFE